MRVLVVDTRERQDAAALAEQIKEMTKVPFRVETKQLDLGDFLVEDEKPDGTRETLAIVERKSYNDFVSSLQPSHMQTMRLKEQTRRICACDRVPVKILFLTGPEYQNLDERMAKTLNTITSRLAIQGMSTVYAPTKTLVTYTLKNLLESVDMCKRKGNELPSDELMLAVRKKRIVTTEQRYITFLRTFDGVSPGLASAIIAEYPTQGHLRQAMRANGAGAITKLKSRNRAISGKIADALDAYCLTA